MRESKMLSVNDVDNDVDEKHVGRGPTQSRAGVIDHQDMTMMALQTSHP